MAEEFEEITHCQMCDAEFRVGRQGNEGNYIPRYHLSVCQRCYDCNRAGWSPLYEQKLIKHCGEHHITLPDRNQSGLLPVE